MSNSFTIKGMDSFKRVSIGHPSHISGTGVHKNRKRDSKLRRKLDKQEARE